MSVDGRFHGRSWPLKVDLDLERFAGEGDRLRHFEADVHALGDRGSGCVKEPFSTRVHGSVAHLRGSSWLVSTGFPNVFHAFSVVFHVISVAVQRTSCLFWRHFKADARMAL